MTPTSHMSYLALLILAGGGLLLLVVIIAVVAAIGSKSKSGSGVAIAVVVALLLGVPVLGVLAFLVVGVGMTTRSIQPPPTVIESQTVPVDAGVPADPVPPVPPSPPSPPAEAPRAARKKTSRPSLMCRSKTSATTRSRSSTLQVAMLSALVFPLPATL